MTPHDYSLLVIICAVAVAFAALMIALGPNGPPK
jgi:hypothetical protein